MLGVKQDRHGVRNHRSQGRAGGAFVRTQAHTAADALRFAREWAEQGITGITIVNPKGESYDIDGFGMIVSTKEEGSGDNRT